jgi:capsular polysaccharide biosynthesis protein
VKTYAELATSQPVLRAIAERQGRGADVKELRDQITVTVVPETFVLSVVATDDSARSAQTLARIASKEVSSYLTGLEKRGTSPSGLEIRVSDPASLPDSPTSPRTTLNLLIAGLLGLLVGLSLAVLAEHRSARALPRYNRFAGAPAENRPGEDGGTRVHEKAVRDQTVPAARGGGSSDQSQ